MLETIELVPAIAANAKAVPVATAGGRIVVRINGQNRQGIVTAIKRIQLEADMNLISVEL